MSIGIDCEIEATILKRVIAPEEGTLSQEGASGLLAIQFSRDDVSRMRELAAKARRGTLTLEEKSWTHAYEKVGSLIGLLQSKARVAIQRAGVEPPQ